MKNVPTLRFKDFSSEWQAKKLGEVTKTITSGSRDWAQYYADAGSKFIRMTNLSRDGIHLKLDDLKFVDVNSLSADGKRTSLVSGDVLISITAELGKIGWIPPNFGEAFINQHTALVRIKAGLANSKLIAYLLSTPKINKKINKLNDAGAKAGLNLPTIKSIDFYFPALQEQTKIADFLTAIDERISQLSQKCDGLAQYKKGVMQKMFSQELRFKDEKGRAFPAWEEKRLDDFLIQDFREVDKPSGEYLSIGVRSHCKGTFQKPETDPDKNSMEKLFVVHQGDLIVNITFAWEGAIAIVGKEDHGGYVSHRFPTYTFNEKITSADFFRYIFVSRVFRTTLELISPGGAGRNRVLSKKEFLKMKVELPCLKEQEKIAGFLSAVDEKISHAQSQLAALKQYKQGLLQQMFV